MKYPEVLDQQQQDNRHIFKLRVSPQLEAFQGHFDSFPIIPGVVQVQWAMYFFKKLEPRSLVASNAHIQKMSTLKFQQIITPNTDINLELSFDEAKQCLSFSIANDQHKCSSGKLFLGTS